MRIIDNFRSFIENFFYLCRSARTWVSAWLKNIDLSQRRCLFAALLCLVTGFSLGFGYLNDKNPGKFRMWQEWYAPAVSMSCGYGYGMLSVEPGDPVDRFLNGEKLTLDCRYVVPDETKALGRYQSNYRYLIGTVGTIWYWTGPDWNVVKSMLIYVYALIAITAFFVARTVLGSTAAAIAALAFVLMPQNLEMLTRLRDIAKVPFIFSISALLVASVDAERKRHWLYAVCTGLVLGFGFGFRPDVATMLPLALLVILFVVPAGMSWRLRTYSASVFVGAAIFAAAPVLLAYMGSNNLPHVTILGLSDYANYQLGIQPGTYLWGINHADYHVAEVLNAYASIKFPQLEVMRYTYPEYASVGMDYLLSMLLTFPGDMFARIGAAVVSLVQLTWLQALHFDSSYRLGALFTLFLVWLSITGLFSFSGLCRRRAVAFSLVSLILISTVALQFDYRHYFHIQIIILVAMLGGVSLISKLRHWRKILIYAFGGASVIFVFLLVHSTLLAIQSFWIEPRLQDFMNSPRESIKAKVSGGPAIAVSFPGFSETAPLPAYPENPAPVYPFVMTVNKAECGQTWLYFRVQYSALEHLNYTFWLESYPADKLALHSTKYRFPNLESLGQILEVTIPAFRKGRALKRVVLSPALAKCVVKWEILKSEDPLFSLMNFVVDEKQQIIPYRIDLNKPRF